MYYTYTNNATQTMIVECCRLSVCPVKHIEEERQEVARVAEKQNFSVRKGEGMVATDQRSARHFAPMQARAVLSAKHQLVPDYGF